MNNFKSFILLAFLTIFSIKSMVVKKWNMSGLAPYHPLILSDIDLLQYLSGNNGTILDLSGLSHLTAQILEFENIGAVVGRDDIRFLTPHCQIDKLECIDYTTCFKNDYYDLIVFDAPWNEMARYKRSKVLEKIARSLKPDGSVYIRCLAKGADKKYKHAFIKTLSMPQWLNKLFGKELSMVERMNIIYELNNYDEYAMTKEDFQKLLTRANLLGDVILEKHQLQFDRESFQRWLMESLSQWDIFNCLGDSKKDFVGDLMENFSKVTGPSSSTITYPVTLLRVVASKVDPEYKKWLDSR